MKRALATVDIETDPFMYGRVPCPFACGFFDGETYHETWGDDCIAEMMDYLAAYKTPLLIYAHNGGKFDYWYMANWISNPVRFINTRMVRGALFHHEIRDSYAILPVKLSALDKDQMDYSIMEYAERDKPKNKAKIRAYLKSDCVYLHHHVEKFIETFGKKLTIGSTAWKELCKSEGIKATKSHEEFDAIIRPFYFGGRVECFAAGEQKGNFNLYDINSSYPNVMRNWQHPATLHISTPKYLPSGLYFAEIVADSDGALPLRTKEGLQFPHIKNQTFLACSHEINTALELGILKIKKVLKVYAFDETQTFAEFVDRCINEKIAAELAGDKSMRLFWKLVANSAYGKAGQNCDNFSDAQLFDSMNQIEKANESIHDPAQWWKCVGDFGEKLLCEKPSSIRNYLNVSIAASVTSAARAELLKGIHSAKRPIYCDTDSIICEKLNAPLHATNLGAWKLEGKADRVFIAGKKLYAAYKDGELVKAAAKGFPLKKEGSDLGIDPDCIRELANGVPIENIELPAPSLRIGKPAKFLKRTIARTAKV